MDSTKLEFKNIRNALIKGLLSLCLPTLLLGIIGETLEPAATSPSTQAVSLLFGLISFVAVFYGYFACWAASCKYAKYKGYPWLLGFIAGFFSIFGIAFLFLLDNKREPEVGSPDDNDFNSFSLWSVIIAFNVMPLVVYPFVWLILFRISNLSPAEIFNFVENESIFYPVFTVIILIFCWVTYKRLKRSNINLTWIFGWKKSFIWIEPLILAIASYLFAIGLNSFTLYRISLISPDLFKTFIGKGLPSSPLGFIFFAIIAIILAPFWEELFFRGIVFQKIASAKGIKAGIIISSLLFAIFHVRYDIIPLSVLGLVAAILYIKTKQIITPILLHFFYNLIVTGYSFYYYFLLKNDTPEFITASGFQQSFESQTSLYIIFLAFSTPYLIYFIYKNFPRYNDISKLPYYVNKARFVEQQPET